MTLPFWVDEKLSNELKELREKGENQDLEYMESFPTNTRELAKEIAAFATANSGKILIGVSNNGDLVGVKETETAESRDSIIRRIEGICKGTIKPSITPLVNFAIESEKTVLVISVPKGDQPIYYSNNVPYIRHITESRPAEPHEVIKIVEEYVSTGKAKVQNDQNDKENTFFSDLARILINIIVYSNEANERQFNPWLNYWIQEFGYEASSLRELAVNQIAIDNNLDNELYRLADSLEAISKFRFSMESGKEFDQLTEDALELAQNMKEKLIDTIPLSNDSIEEIKTLIVSSCRKIKNLSERAEEMIRKGHFDDLQSEASTIGKTLLTVSYYNVKDFGDNFLMELRKIATKLHLVETMPIYADGGESTKRIMNQIVECNDELFELVNTSKEFKAHASPLP